LKNKEELELFKLIYRDIFYFIGIFSSIDSRVKNLEENGIKTHEVYELINRDSGEEMNFGQKVTDTFIESDFFMRIDNNSKHAIEAKLKKYLNLIFSSDIVTPTPDETAMYLASSASGNSACLSRQVGASITDKFGEIISIGWNDVPKAGGGVYQSNSNELNTNEDHRCMNLKGGLCFNDREKQFISEALANELITQELIPEAKRNEILKIIKSSRIKELIEFSRAVHAEMLALIVGSQKAGSRIIGGKLYCTTYPCHNCARHIVAAGIKEVYYIEPYRKSLAIKLHDDSITEDESKTNLVRILLFDGVSPKRYLEFYKMESPRKKDGKKIKVGLKESVPKNTLSLQAIPILEKKVTEDLLTRELIHI
jgi:deoxycytidylate deaminase